MSSNTASQPAEFVAEAFDTSVSTEAENELIELLDKTIRNLREQIDDDTLEKCCEPVVVTTSSQVV